MIWPARGRTCRPWNQTAVLGDHGAACRAGIAGVVVPSFAKGAVAADINAVFWDWAPNPPHQVRVIDDDQATAERREFLAVAEVKLWTLEAA